VKGKREDMNFKIKRRLRKRRKKVGAALRKTVDESVRHAVHEELRSVRPQTQDSQQELREDLRSEVIGHRGGRRRRRS
jgi:hypothetical protein